MSHLLLSRALVPLFLLVKKAHSSIRSKLLLFIEFGALAVKHNSVNLAQGAPDFDAPDFVLKAGHVCSYKYAQS